MGLRLSDIKKISGRSGLSIKKIRRRSDMAVLWSAEEYIYQNGTLADGITISSLSNTDGVLLADTGGQDKDESETIYAGICGIDCTDYDRIDITLTHKAYVNYGSAYIKYGIGYVGESEYTMLNDDAGEQTTTITIDISTHTGAQDIYFYLYAKNKSSESTWTAYSWIKISEIKLYNADSESSGESTDVDLTSTDDGEGNVIVYALTGRVYATDDGEGNVTIKMSGATDDTTIG